METSDLPSFMKQSYRDAYGLKVEEVQLKWGGEGESKPFETDDNFQNDERLVKSEIDATEVNVKRDNLIQIFLKGTEVDKYIASHLYGKETRMKQIENGESMGEMTLLDNFQLDNTFTHKIRLLHEMQLNQSKLIVDDEGGSRRTKKLNAFETYVALIKGYCALMILVLPKSFESGGYLFSPIVLVLSALVQMISATKLVRTGLHLGLTSYSLIALKTLGTRGKQLLDLMIATTQFSFSLSLVTYITQSWKIIALSVFGLDVHIWSIAYLLMMILVPIAWVRNISKFSFTFLMGNLLILATLVTVVIVLSVKLYDRGGSLGNNLLALNSSQCMSMVGFSCYTFEGIGVVMPIMSACECPEKFERILFYAFATLTLIYILFSDFCYLVLGDELKKTFITQELDQKSKIVVVLQLFMSLNLICSYAIMIYPTNNILEDYLLRSLKPKGSPATAQYQKAQSLRHLLQNLSRTVVCFLATYLAIELSDKLDKFLAILGALLCAPLAILYPSLMHLKTLARTRGEKLEDIFFIALSLMVLVFSTA